MTITKNPNALQNRIDPWETPRYPEEEQAGVSEQRNPPKREDLPQNLRPFFDMGKLACEVHQSNCLFIDMRLNNVGYRQNTERLLITGYTATMDYGEAPPAIERARDLALFRTECNYQQWQAVKAGYRELGSDTCDEVFKLFDAKPD